MKIISRIERVSYAIRDIVLEAKELEKKGKDMLYLNIGDPIPYGFSPPKVIVEALKEAAEMRELKGYMPSFGYKELREEIANQHDTSMENVFVTFGLTEAIDFLFFLLADEEQHILLHDPTYPLYITKAKLYSKKAMLINFTNEEELRKTLEKENISALVIISPNNPDGYVFKEKELKKIIDIAGEYDVLIFYDGAYDDLAFVDLPDFERLAKDVPYIYGQSMSKNFIYPGARVGWVVFSENKKLEKLKEGFQKLCNQRLSVNGEMQYAALKALQSKSQGIEEFKRKLMKRRDVLKKIVEENELLDANLPEGAFYYWIKFKTKLNDWEFVRFMMREEGIVAVPSSAFSKSKEHFRIVYLPDEEKLLDFGERMERIAKKLM